MITFDILINHLEAPARIPKINNTSLKENKVRGLYKIWITTYKET